MLQPFPPPSGTQLSKQRAPFAPQFGSFLQTVQKYSDAKTHNQKVPLPAPLSQVPSTLWRSQTSFINPLVLKRQARGRASVPVEGIDFDDVSGQFYETLFPAVGSVHRDEVVALAETLDKMMDTIDTSVLLNVSRAVKHKSSQVAAQHQLESATDAADDEASDAELHHITLQKIKQTARAVEFDHETFHQVQQQLTQVLMLGWMEVVRQNFMQCADRGVLLEKIRCCFADLLQNAYDAADYYRKQCQDIQELGIEDRIHQLYQRLLDKDLEIQAWKHSNENLQETIAKFEEKEEELERLRQREAFLTQFVTNQAARNATLLQVKNKLESGNVVRVVGGSRSSRHSRFTSEVRRSEAIPRSSVASDRRSVMSTSDGDGKAVEAATTAEDISPAQPEEAEEEETEEEEVASFGPATLDCGVQVEFSALEDDALFHEASNFIRQLQKTCEASDKLAHTIYGSGDFANPSYHVGLAQKRLEEVKSRALTEHETTKMTKMDDVLPQRGLYQINQGTLTGFLRDGFTAMKEVGLRINAMLQHSGLRKALFEPLKAPTKMTEQCPLCHRLGHDAKIANVIEDLEEAKKTIAELQGGESQPLKSALKRTSRFDTVEMGINTEDLFCGEASPVVEKGRRMSVSGRSDEDDTPSEKGRLTPRQGKKWSTPTAPEPPAAKTLGRRRSSIKQPSPLEAFGRRSSAAPPPVTTPLQPTTTADKSSRDAEKRSSSPPLKIELIINCHCQHHKEVPELLQLDALQSVNPPESPAKLVSLTTSPASRSLQAKEDDKDQPDDDEGNLSLMMSPSIKKKAQEIAARLQAVRNAFALAKSCTTTPKTTTWSLKLIHSLYKSKYKSDAALLTEQGELLTCAEHFVDYMKQTYGTKRLVEEQMRFFLGALTKYKSDPRIDLFSQFFFGTFSKQMYRFFIRFRKLLDDSVSLFDSSAKIGDEVENHPAKAPLEAFVYCSMQILRDRYFLMDVIQLAVNLSQVTSNKNFRSLSVDGSELAVWNIPADSANREVVRAEFFLRFCQLVDKELSETESASFRR